MAPLDKLSTKILWHLQDPQLSLKDPACAHLRCPAEDISLSDILPAAWRCTTWAGSDYRSSHLPGRSSGISGPRQEEKSCNSWELLSVFASMPHTGAGHGFQKAEGALAGARPQVEPLVGCPSLRQPKAAGWAYGSGSWKLGPPWAWKASHFTQQPDVREETKNTTPHTPSRLTADLFHVSVSPHFRCCHYTQLGYFRWKYLRRNENSLVKINVQN